VIFMSIKRSARRERGQEALEFALIFPILFLILVGIFDLGRATYFASMVHNIAREGARYGTVFPDDTAGIQAAVENLAIGVDPAVLVITITVDEGAGIIQVTVGYDMPLVTPLIGSFFGGANTLPLSSQATMQLE
jgi:Flp pilus assembly protein TadG